MSAWSRCGQPSCWQVPFFQSMLRGTSGQRLMPRRDGLTACQTSMNGWPTISTCLPMADLTMPWAIRLSFDPGTRWSTRTPTRRCGPGLKSRRCSARSSTPPRNSTTTPSIRRSSPHTFSTSSASCRPSTKIRLARATRAFTSWTATEPLAVRVFLAGPDLDRAPQHDRLALEQEARAEREGTPLGAPVLERHRVEVAVDGDDLAAPVGDDLLEDHPDLGRYVDGAASSGRAPVGVEDVGAVTIRSWGKAPSNARSAGRCSDAPRHAEPARASSPPALRAAHVD